MSSPIKFFGFGAELKIKFCFAGTGSGRHTHQSRAQQTAKQSSQNNGNKRLQEAALQHIHSTSWARPRPCPESLCSNPITSAAVHVIWDQLHVRGFAVR